MITDDTACISCGARLADGGGRSPSSTEQEPVCVECVNTAQGKMQRMHVYVAIDEERAYQDAKHGDHKHTPAEWMLILGDLLAKANQAFGKGGSDCDTKILDITRKIAATAIACMEQCGVVSREKPKCDVCGDTWEQHQTEKGYDHEYGGIPPIPGHVTTIIMQSDLRKSIEGTLNRFSAENGSNTPDFILAQYIIDSLSAYDKAVTAREKWYGRAPVPVPPDQAPPPPVSGLSCGCEGGICEHQSQKIDPVGKPFLSSI